MSQAFSYCRECQGIRVVILTGAGDKAFCSGGDMHVKGRGGYVGSDGVPRLNVLDVQMQIRRLPKPVIAMVNGYAIGGGHVLHVMCDLTIASENAIFGQTGPKSRQFRCWFRCFIPCPHGRSEEGTRNLVPLQAIYCQGSRRNGHGEQGSAFGPTGRYLCGMGRNHDRTLLFALRMIKAGLNAELDGQAGIQELAGDATMLYYTMDEAQEGGKAFLEEAQTKL